MHDDLADKALRLDRLDILEELGTEACIPAVLPLLADPTAQPKVLGVLGRFGDKRVGDAVLAGYPTMPPAVQARARDVLFSRAEWAKGFLALADAGRIAPTTVPVEQVRRLSLLNDAEIDAGSASTGAA